MIKTVLVHKAEKAVNQLVGKKTYTKAVLTVFGKVANLTAGSSPAPSSENSMGHPTWKNRP